MPLYELPVSGSISILAWSVETALSIFSIFSPSTLDEGLKFGSSDAFMHMQIVHWGRRPIDAPSEVITKLRPRMMRKWKINQIFLPCIGEASGIKHVSVRLYPLNLLADLSSTKFS